MIERLLQSALNNRFATFVATVALAVAGWYAYKNLTIEAFPDPTDVQVDVITLYPGQRKNVGRPGRRRTASLAVASVLPFLSSRHSQAHEERRHHSGVATQHDPYRFRLDHGHLTLERSAKPRSWTSAFGVGGEAEPVPYCRARGDVL